LFRHMFVSAMGDYGEVAALLGSIVAQANDNITNRERHLVGALDFALDRGTFWFATRQDSLSVIL
jgi:hypothetical protein